MSNLRDRLTAAIIGYRPVPSDYCPHVPTLKQNAMLTCGHREGLFGGAAGGGKSDFLLMAALQWVHVPDYAALLLRRTWSDLNKPNAILSRAHSWFAGTKARWLAAKGQYIFPSGAIISFGHLQDEADKFNYQGAEYQFIGFDELTQFTETQYLYLLSRLRRLKGAAVPIRIRGASNPGGRGHDWVRRRFIVEGLKEGRVFVPSRMEDNPHLDQDEYDATLQALDPVTRRQLRHGDWDVRPDGDLFKRAWLRCIDVAPARPRFRVRFWDFASTEAKEGTDPDFTAGALLSWTPGAGYVLEDLVAVRESPATVERIVRQTAERDAALEGGTETVIEEEGGASGKHMARHYLTGVLAGFTARAMRPTGDKVYYARALSAAAEGGQLALVRGAWVEDFINEAVAFPLGAHDDRVDATSKALAVIAQRLRATQDIGAPVSIPGGIIPRT